MTIKRCACDSRIYIPKTYMGVFFWVCLDLVIRNSSLSSVLKFEDDRWNFQGSYVCLSVQKFFPFGIWTFSRLILFLERAQLWPLLSFNKFSHEFEFLADCVWFALQFITPKAYSRIGYTWSLTLRHLIPVYKHWGHSPNAKFWQGQKSVKDQ